MTKSVPTKDTLLEGRVHLRQPEIGYRVAMDTVLIASAVPIGQGERLLDVGAGTGGIGLCVLARAPKIAITALEPFADHARLLRQNLSGIDAEIIEGSLESKCLAGRTFNHIVTNPPFFEEGAHRASPNSSKAAAAHSSITLQSWVSLCLKRLDSGGSFSIVHRASKAAEILGAIGDRLGNLLCVPIYTKGNSPWATRVIIRGSKGSRAPFRMHKGLMLHTAEGRETPEALALLRSGVALDDVLETL